MPTSNPFPSKKDNEAEEEEPPTNAPSTPQIANKELTITCDVAPQSRDGVILAQGGTQQGYALYLADGKPTFAVREDGELFTASSPTAPTGKFSLQAQLKKNGTMTLSINSSIVAQGKAQGLIQVQPKDDLSIGKDTKAAVGNYPAPNPLQGQIENVNISPR